MQRGGESGKVGNVFRGFDLENGRAARSYDTLGSETDQITVRWRGVVVGAHVGENFVWLPPRMLSGASRTNERRKKKEMKRKEKLKKLKKLKMTERRPAED